MFFAVVAQLDRLGPEVQVIRPKSRPVKSKTCVLL